MTEIKDMEIAELNLLIESRLKRIKERNKAEAEARKKLTL